MRTKSWMTASAALVALLAIGPSATATAQTPEPEEELAAAVSVPLGPGTELQSIEYELPWSGGVRACAGVDHSRNSETDAIAFYCDDSGKGWYHWDINRAGTSSGGTQLYEIKNPYTGLCLSLEGVESGAADNGHDGQQEPCERQHDARWWFSSDSRGHVLIRSYSKNSAGRYPCLEIDNSDVVGDVSVQVWDCGSSQAREWALSPNN